MRFERTSNLALVKSVLTQPGIWPYIGDDFAPEKELFRVNADSRIWYVLVVDKSVWPEGLFSFVPENPICWAVHVAMVRGRRPSFNREVGEKIVPWIWENTDCGG
jgi:hypothetical protein